MSGFQVQDSIDDILLLLNRKEKDEKREIVPNYGPIRYL